jgi:protein ImuA
VTETGAGHAAPLALLLTPGDGGAAGVESRWHLTPDHRHDDSRWHLARLRARTAPPQSWQVRTGGKGGVAEVVEMMEPA